MQKKNLLCFFVGPIKLKLHFSQPRVVMSALERDEMDRLLHDTRMELFAQKRQAREELEALQEVKCPTRRPSQLGSKIPEINSTKIFPCLANARNHVEQRLEETCEELQRVADAESILRSRFSSLEEEQRQDKEQRKVINRMVLHTIRLLATESFGNLIISSFFSLSESRTRD